MYHIYFSPYSTFYTLCTIERSMTKGEKKVWKKGSYSKTAASDDVEVTPPPPPPPPPGAADLVVVVVNGDFSSHRIRAASLAASLAFARSHSAAEGVRHSTSSVRET